MQSATQRLRMCGFAFGVAAALLIALPATAAEPSFVHKDSHFYGTFNGIDYLEYRLEMHGDGYWTTVYLWAPADPTRANGRVLVDLPNTVPGAHTEFTRLVLGDALLFERGFIRASVHWNAWAPDFEGEIEGFPSEDHNENALVRLGIVADLAEALRDGCYLAALTGELDLIYSFGISQTGGMQRRLLLDPLEGRHRPLFDGWFILVGHRLTFGVWPPILDPPGKDDGFVITLNSETDVSALQAWRVREGPRESFRSYEVVGPHTPVADWAEAWGMTFEEFCALFEVEEAVCDRVSRVRWWFVARALFLALDDWAVKGEPPPDSTHLDYDPDNPDNPDHFDHDDFGNRLNRRGGIRSPEVEVGAILSKPLLEDAPPLVRLVGESEDLDITLQYENHGEFMVAYTEAVLGLVEDGFLLREEAAAMIAAAASDRDGWGW